MDIEREFIDYLQVYGNTKESDLIEFGVNISHQSKRHTRSVLDRMVLEGKTQRVIHDKLGQNVVYFTREGCCLHELAMEIETDAADLKDIDNISELAGKILREAAALAEKRIKERYPEYKIG